MFSPVTVNPANGLPQLSAAVGNVYGATADVPANDVSYLEGPTFGINDVSQPNTSPDVISICARLALADFEGKPTRMVMPGTPVKIDKHPMEYNGGNEPLHEMKIIANKETDLFTSFCDDKGFLTVTLGEVLFHKNKSTYVAVAIQNVATVSLAHHLDDLKNVCVGDKLMLRCAFESEDPDGQREDKLELLHKHDGQHYNSNSLQRELTVVSLPIGHTVKCDLGRITMLSDGDKFFDAEADLTDTDTEGETYY